jgi:hypothetical protein
MKWAAATHIILQMPLLKICLGDDLLRVMNLYLIVAAIVESTGDLFFGGSLRENIRWGPNHGYVL